MYFNGNIGIDIVGTQLEIQRPSNFFGRIANAIAGGRFEKAEEQETYRIMALAQGINRSLRELGVNNMIRLAIDDRVIYEDKEHLEDDYRQAMESLQESDIDPAGLDLNEVDIICEHDDGTLHYIIDFDIFRFHKPGTDPITINVTAVPKEMARRRGEPDKQFESRVKAIFSDQKRIDAFKNEKEMRFNTFMESLKLSLEKNIGIEVEKNWMDVKTCLPTKVDEDKYIKVGSKEYTQFGPSLVYYNPWWDLYYLHFMGQALTDHRDISLMGVSVIGSDGGSISGYESGITGLEYAAVALTVTESGAGASLDTESVSSDSGGGGWLASLGFSSDSGGGGDAGGSSCGSSCGGGCGGGCGS
jgi:hypothetical protein